MARSEDFAGGADAAREPQFKTVQSQHNANFHGMSVLDTPYTIPNQNGMGSADLQRRIMGFHESVSGQSESTFDQSIWLRTPENANRDLPGKKEENGKA